MSTSVRVVAALLVAFVAVAYFALGSTPPAALLSRRAAAGPPRAPTVTLAATLAEAKTLLKQSPWESIAFLKSALERGALRRGEARARVMNEVADAYRFAKDFGAARKWRRRALALQTKELGRVLSSSASAKRRTAIKAVLERTLTQSSLATDMTMGGQSSRALKLVQDALRQPGLPTAAAAVLARAESAVHECTGDAVSALLRFEEATKASAASGPLSVPPSASDAIHLVGLLRRVLRGASPPPHVARAMAQRADALAVQLVRDGEWEATDQLPRHFVRGVSTGPWPSLDADVPELRPLVALLERPATVAALRAEFAALRAAGRMRREWECIHDASRGAWTRFEVTGAWHPAAERDARGCNAAATPVACALLRALRALDVAPVFRAGFSAVEAAAWITPHYGVSNAQLKLHLGLVVPEGADGAPCARLTVGNATNAWRDGEALLFDDSWRHEVRNECGAERVVFQVVVGHPRLKAARAARGESFGIEDVFQ
jgi:aspartate beta-hydroxylase